MQIHINGIEAEVPRREHLTVHELLKLLEVEDRSSEVTVEVNSVEIPQSKWLKEGANPDDVVEITFD